MRERISRKLLNRFEKYMPQNLRRRQLQVLMNLAAKSFGMSRETLGKGSAAEALRQYADYTCRCMRGSGVLESGAEEGGANRSTLEETLFRDARRLGEKIRRITVLTADEDLKRLIVLLYRNIGIHMTIDGRIAGANEKQITGETEGRTEDEITSEIAANRAAELTVSACYFSRCYSPVECKLMSYVDAGIVTGICGGGCLRFSQRITEGCGFCRAHLTEDGEILQKGKCNE